MKTGDNCTRFFASRESAISSGSYNGTWSIQNSFKTGSISRPRVALERKSRQAVRASCSPSGAGAVHKKCRNGDGSGKSFHMACCRLPLRTDTLFLGVSSALFVNRPCENAWRRELAIEADSTGGRQGVACWRAAPEGNFHFPQLFQPCAGSFAKKELLGTGKRRQRQREVRT